MNKLTVDLRMLRASGIGTYLQQVIPRLTRLLQNVHFCFIGNPKDIASLDLGTRTRAEFLACSAPIYSLKEQYLLLNIIPKNTQLFWSPHFNVPLFYKGKLIVTIHDLFPLSGLDQEKRLLKTLYANIFFSHIAKHASKILCVSEFTRREFLGKYPKAKEKLEVVLNGVAQTSDSRNGLTLRSDREILFVGNVKPHKNLLALIQAFVSVHEKISYSLVIVGQKNGFITGDNAAIQTANRFPERIRFTGYISNEELAKHYQSAAGLIFPSLYEGFGLPPLEAMSFGCPVLASDIPSLREVCQDAAIYFDPNDYRDIAKKILSTLGNKELLEQLRQKGLARAKTLNWEKTANLIAHIFRNEF